MSRYSTRWVSTASDVVLASVAVALLGWVIVRDKASEPTAVSNDIARVVSQAQWQHARALGREVGDSSGTLEVVEFLDLECPGCEIYHRTVIEPLLGGEFGPSISLRIVHFPLRAHRNARDAAMAAECAAEHGVFAQFVSVALERQSEFSPGAWARIALASGVADTVGFNACRMGAASLDRVDAGRMLGDSIGVTGTPSILVSGRLFSLPPTRETLLAYIKGGPNE